MPQGWAYVAFSRLAKRTQITSDRTDAIKICDVNWESWHRSAGKSGGRFRLALDTEERQRRVDLDEGFDGCELTVRELLAQVARRSVWQWLNLPRSLHGVDLAITYFRRFLDFLN